jgi:hypothetical protein
MFAELLAAAALGAVKGVQLVTATALLTKSLLLALPQKGG